MEPLVLLNNLLSRQKVSRGLLRFWSVKRYTRCSNPLAHPQPVGVRHDNSSFSPESRRAKYQCWLVWRYCPSWRAECPSTLSWTAGDAWRLPNSTTNSGPGWGWNREYRDGWGTRVSPSDSGGNAKSPFYRTWWRWRRAPSRRLDASTGRAVARWLGRTATSGFIGIELPAWRQQHVHVRRRTNRSGANGRIACLGESSNLESGTASPAARRQYVRCTGDRCRCVGRACGASPRIVLDRTKGHVRAVQQP